MAVLLTVFQRTGLCLPCVPRQVSPLVGVVCSALCQQDTATSPWKPASEIEIPVRGLLPSLSKQVFMNLLILWSG